eukprot:Nk52_evm37s292 gene=Nk52_evmTU37s292
MVFLICLSLKVRLFVLPGIAQWSPWVNLKDWEGEEEVKKGKSVSFVKFESSSSLGRIQEQQLIQQFSSLDAVILVYAGTNCYLGWLFKENLHPDILPSSRFLWIIPFFIATTLIIVSPILNRLIDHFLFVVCLGMHHYTGSNESSTVEHSLLAPEGDMFDSHSAPHVNECILYRSMLFVKALLSSQYWIFVVSLFHVLYHAPFDDRYRFAVCAYTIPYFLLSLVYLMMQSLSCAAIYGGCLNGESLGALISVGLPRMISSSSNERGGGVFKSIISRRRYSTMLLFIYIFIVVMLWRWKVEWRLGLGGKEYSEIIDVKTGDIICHYPTFYLPFIKFIYPPVRKFLYEETCPDERTRRRRKSLGPKLTEEIRNFASIKEDRLIFDDTLCGGQGKQHKRSYVLCSDFVSSLPYTHLNRLATGADSNRKCKEGEYNIEYTYDNLVDVEGYGYVRAFCDDSEMAFLRNVKNVDAERRVKEYLKEKKDKGMYKKLNPDTSGDIQGVKLNVLVLVVDGLSRAHFRRSLPKTTDFLNGMYGPDAIFQRNVSAQTTGSFAYQFFHYNSVALNTEINTGTMFTGKQSPGERLDKDFWINSYRDNGFITADVNGYCQSTFFYHKGGTFPLSDHEIIHPFCHPDYTDPNSNNNAQGPYSIFPRCIGQKHVHNYLFDYVNSFWKNYEDVPKAMFATFEEAHEGTGLVISSMDDSFHDFLQKFHADGHLHNTVLFLTADHGLHMGPYFETFPGGVLEQKLPALFVVVPAWLPNKLPYIHGGLLDNENTLVTAADIFKTLKYIETMNEKTTESMKKDTEGTLFGSIPQRTCAQANIPLAYCGCLEHQFG